MAFQYQYGIYNPGQYPVDAQALFDAMVADGWQVRTAAPAYNEIYILWQRELPGAHAPVVQEEEESGPPVTEPAPVSPDSVSRDRDSLGRFQPTADTSGELAAHEGQDAQ